MRKPPMPFARLRPIGWSDDAALIAAAQGGRWRG
jgi:hypothetical protein